MVIKTQDMVHEIQNTSAIFGRNKEVKVIFEGDQAYTNGQEIVLPAMIQNATVDGETQKIMRGYLDHEAGHVRHTDFNVWTRHKKETSGALRAIHNCVEDIWLEARVMSEYPGAKKNLSHLNTFTNKKEIEVVKGEPHRFKDVNMETVCLGITSVGRKDYKSEGNQELIDALPEGVAKHAPKWIELTHKCKSTEQTFRLAKHISKLVKEDPELKSDPEDFNPDLESDDGVGNPSDWGEGKDKNTGEGKTGVKIVDEINDIAKDIFGGSGITPPKTGGVRGQYRVLSTRWDQVVHKNDPDSGLHLHERMKKASGSDYDKLKGMVSSHVMVMKSKLRRAISSLEQRNWDFARETGQVDSKRLVQAFLGAQNTYKRRVDREELDTAVHMLVDLSGSMCGGKMNTAALSAIAFAECFEGTSINYQISGFNNSNRGDGYTGMQDLCREAKGIYHRAEALNIFKFKSFNDKLFNVKGSVSTLFNAAGGNNSDQCALMWAYDQLKKQPQKRKILLVFSDGSPAVYTVGRPDLYAPLKEAVDWIESSGVECIGIGIHHNVSGIYKNNAQVSDLSDLSGVMFNKLTNILLRKR